MSTEIRQSAPRPVVVTPTKSVGIQILLVIFLGPLGLFYSTIKGTLIMIFGVPIALAALVAITGLVAAHGGAGVGTAVAVGSEILLTMLVWWVGSFVWGIVAVNSYNKRLLQG
ncbi:MAG: hypothetical protein ACYDAE_12990 [Steroidobacteraceae bacterium]